MRSKIKYLIALIMLGVTLCVFTACDLSFGNSTSSNQSGSGDKTEKKISFADAEDKYSALEVKRADSSAYLGVTFYLNSLPTEEKVEKHVVSIAADAERRTAGESSYAELSLEPGTEQSESAVGLLAIVKQAFGGDMTDAIFGKLDEEVKATLKDISSFVEYMQGFLQDKIDLYARAGRRDGVTNFKTGYVYRKTDSEPQKGEGWYSVGDEFIKSIFGFDISTTDFADGLYPAAFFDIEKGRDVASERVNKNGLAEYDVNFTAEGIKNFIGNLAQKAGDAICKDSETGKEALGLIAEGFSAWLDTEKSASRFTAAVGADKLPTKTRAETVLVFNVSAKDFRDRVNALKDSGVLSAQVADTMNVVTYLLSQYACGTNGEKGKIGLEVKFSAEETYSYAASDCSIEGIDEDMFASDNEDGERINIEDYFKKLTENEATAFLGDALSALGDAADEIVGTIKMKLGTLEGVNLAELKKAAFAALDEYVTDDEGIKEAIEQIKKEFFSDRK